MVSGHLKQAQVHIRDGVEGTTGQKYHRNSILHVVTHIHTRSGHPVLTECIRAAGGIRTRDSPILSVRNLTVGLARFCAPQPSDACERARARPGVAAAESHVGLAGSRGLKASWAPTRAEAGSQGRWLCLPARRGAPLGVNGDRGSAARPGGDQVTRQISPRLTSLDPGWGRSPERT